ncbi:MAG TPA: DUF2058 domain-containing protein [Thiolinea sp.]|nr:DUF2058 domain-containing protein [Thiolinea sp.]
MSLKDQLLKAGLVDKSKADQAERELRKKAHRKTAKGKKSEEPEAADAVKVAAEQARQSQAERSRELNRQQREAAEQRAIQAQIRQLVAMNRVARINEEAVYQFADGSRVKELHMAGKLREQVAGGLLAIARLDRGYELVPKGVAEKIMQRDASAILVLNTRADNIPDEDDPYAAFQVPDDLMW